MQYVERLFSFFVQIQSDASNTLEWYNISMAIVSRKAIFAKKKMRLPICQNHSA